MTSSAGRTSRGLRRVPKYEPPADERPQPKRPKESPGEQRKGRRQTKYKLFSLGAGIDVPLFVFILVLLAIGLVMLFSASYAYCYYYYDSSYYFIMR